MKDKIKEILQKACDTLAINTTNGVKIDFTEDLNNGDLTSNVAMVYAKSINVSPKDLATKITENIRGNSDAMSIVEKVEVAGPGFINFYLKREVIIDYLNSLGNIGNNVGVLSWIKKLFGIDYSGSAGLPKISNIGNGKRVLVEYSSPNIAKPFTVGHLRSTVIGDAIANILSATGYDVIRDNHLGDWGTQFGKLLVAIEKWGDLETIKKEERPIKALVDLYVKFHDEVDRLNKSDNINDKTQAEELETLARAKFKALEDGAPEIVSIWKICVDLSMKEFQTIYERLGVIFDSKRGDTQLGESFYVSKEKTSEVLNALNEKGLLKESEGAKVVFFGSEDPKKWKYPPLIIEKSDGTSIYATRDLAADLYRLNTYGKSGGLTVINEVGVEQSLYFKQLFETEKMLGWYDDGKRIHIAHGLYRFKDGKMSTRKGNVIWLEDILDEAELRASKINTESAKKVAIGAVKFNDLRRDSIQDIVFDWDEMMNMTGDSGPYLQYSCVRARSVLEKGKSLGINTNINGSKPDSLELIVLEKILSRFIGTVEFAGQSYKPNILANYLINLASAFNSFYAHNIIADKNDAGASYKMTITKIFADTLEKGLGLLGIEVPERM